MWKTIQQFFHKIILWKNVENSLKQREIGHINGYPLWNVENFQNFHKKLWKNGVMIILPLQGDSNDND